MESPLISPARRSPTTDTCIRPKIEGVHKRTLRLIHPRGGELIVDDTRTGEHTRRKLRQAMQEVREGQSVMNGAGER